jgi:hypothetical protein
MTLLDQPSAVDNSEWRAILVFRTGRRLSAAFSLFMRFSNSNRVSMGN